MKNNNNKKRDKSTHFAKPYRKGFWHSNGVSLGNNYKD